MAGTGTAANWRRLARTLGTGFALCLAAGILAAPSALAAKPKFASDVVLPGGLGGEPSIAVDTSPTASRNSLYTVAIGDPNGPLEWHHAFGGALVGLALSRIRQVVGSGWQLVTGDVP